MIQPSSESQMPDPQSTALRRTPLAAVHAELGATMTGFAGWQMPLRYRSETAEHNAVRNAAGLFDLSHMGELLVTGEGAAAALDYALVGDASAIKPGRARYTMICAPNGGVIDDLIVYRLAQTRYLIVANAANAATVAEELAERAEHVARPVDGGTTVSDQTAGYALIALQGPRSAAILAAVSDMTSTDLDQLRYYASYQTTIAGSDALLARTGYTGEDGFELFIRPQDAVPLWHALTEAGSGEGLVPAGLAARDSLRLEAGMPLYGNELSRDVTPFEAGLGRVVKLDKPGDFVGRAALADRARTGPTRVLVGLAGQTRRVPRHGYTVLWDGEPCGTVTSGAPSPTLGRPIAMAYLTAEAAEAARSATGSGGGRLAVDIRGSAEPADLEPLPFYQRPAPG
jgi:aminomethyltransferase